MGPTSIRANDSGGKVDGIHCTSLACVVEIKGVPGEGWEVEVVVWKTLKDNDWVGLGYAFQSMCRHVSRVVGQSGP